MTETAKTIIQVTTAFARWIANHINTGGEIARQVLFLATVLGYVHLTPDQQINLIQGVSGIIAAITGASVVSKVRFGERVEEKAETKAQEKVAAIMSGTGDGQ